MFRLAKQSNNCVSVRRGKNNSHKSLTSQRRLHLPSFRLEIRRQYPIDSELEVLAGGQEGSLLRAERCPGDGRELETVRSTEVLVVLVVLVLVVVVVGRRGAQPRPVHAGRIRADGRGTKRRVRLLASV